MPVTSWTKPNWAERCLHNSGDLSPVEKYAAKVSKGIQLHVWYFYLISPWCSEHSCQYSSQAEMERADGAGSRWKTSIFPKYLETEICMSRYLQFSTISTCVPPFHLNFSEGIKLVNICSPQWWSPKHLILCLMSMLVQKWISNKWNCPSLYQEMKNYIFVKSTPSKLFPVTKTRNLDEHVTRNVAICKQLTIIDRNTFDSQFVNH